MSCITHPRIYGRDTHTSKVSNCIDRIKITQNEIYKANYLHISMTVCKRALDVKQVADKIDTIEYDEASSVSLHFIVRTSVHRDRTFNVYQMCVNVSCNARIG